MVDAEEGNSWIYKNKDHGKRRCLPCEDCYNFCLQGCCLRPQALVLVYCGIPILVSVMWTNTPTRLRSTSRLVFALNLRFSFLTRVLQAGAFLATGILNTGVRSEADAALALLGDHISNNSVPLRTSAIVGLGFAYAGSHREDILFMLVPLISDDGISMEIAALAALAVGLIFVGSENGEAALVILQTLMEREDRALDEKWTRFLGLGLALLYVGK